MDKSIREKLYTFFSSYPAQAFIKGSTILQAEREPTGILYITSGVVRNYWISPEGSEVTLNMYKSHAFFPMAWAIADIQNTTFCEAMTAVTVRKAPKVAVLQFLKENPDVMYDLLKRIYIGIEGLWMHIESLTTGDSSLKLVTSIVILAKRFGTKKDTTTVVQLQMSEKNLANYAGITRETASRELQKLKKNNLVFFEKGIITIQDMATLEELLHR